MHNTTRPVDWRDIAAAYDARGLPFIRYFVEAGLAERKPRPRDRK